MIFLEKHAHLVLKTPLAVVFFLRVDVTKQYAEIGRTNRKQTIPPLPREGPSAVSLHPRRGRSLDLRHNLRSIFRGCEPQRQMDVIGHSSRAKALTAQVAGHFRKICMKFSFAILRDQWSPVFGAKDNVNEVETQRLRHCGDYMSRFQPSGSLLIAYLVCRRSFGPCPDLNFHTSLLTLNVEAIRNEEIGL